MRAKGGIASINHADSPGGEICMGCAWEPPTNLDMSLFTGVEVINGGRVFLSSADVWDREIAREIGKGATLTAIGGSDNHNAPSEAGHPAPSAGQPTVVEADNLSVPAILDGIRPRPRLHRPHRLAQQGSRPRSAEPRCPRPGRRRTSHHGRHAHGERRRYACLRRDAPLGCSRSHIHFFLDGKESDSIPTLDTHIDAEGNGETLSFQWKTDGHPHWIRAEVRDSNSSLMLVSNPIYIHAAH